MTLKYSYAFNKMNLTIHKLKMTLAEWVTYYYIFKILSKLLRQNHQSAGSWLDLFKLII